MKLKINKKIAYTGIAIVFIGLFIYYIIKPVNFDTRLYLGAAYQADLIGSFPTNLFDAWEHKLILNRFIFYFIHKLACLFVSADNVVVYEMIVKAIYGLFAVGLITLFTKQTKEFFLKYKINQLIVFSSLYLIVIFSNNMYDMQTEMTGLLLLLIPIMLVLKEKNVYKIVAGFFISLLFFLKGVTIIYAIIILIIMLLEKQSIKSIAITIGSSFAFLLLEILGIWIWRPEEIIETLLASQYMQKEWAEIGVPIYFLSNYVQSIYICIGTCALVYNTICNIKNKNIKLFLIELVCYVFLFFGVYIQKLIITYQMALMMPAFLLSFFIFIYNLKNNKIKIGILGGFITGIILLDFLIIMICVNIDRADRMNVENDFKIAKIQEIYEKYPDLKDDEVLYIGNGYSAYYFKAKSYLKYTTTIYLTDDNPTYENNEYIEKIKEKAKEYKGKYIILDDIELTTKRRVSEDIIKYINDNYTVAEYTGMNCIEDQMKDKHVLIYMRKDCIGVSNERENNTDI